MREFVRHARAMPMPCTAEAIRRLMETALGHARQGYSECLEPRESCTCPEEAILIAAAVAMCKMSGEDIDREVPRWIADFHRQRVEMS